ncbi:MAG: CBS domain-containing protein [Rhodospirillales bacterium]|nr:CBS domain-containing protein [Rhodospirillales bacterium]
MKITEILQHKGVDVVKIGPDAAIADAARLLIEKGVGSLVVCDRVGRFLGLLAERDIVRGMAAHGPGAAALRVDELMNRDALTCRPGDMVKDIMSLIVVRRARHVPVVEGERLVGLVSIGDVLKSRLEEQAHEVNVLRDLTRVRA